MTRPLAKQLHKQSQAVLAVCLLTASSLTACGSSSSSASKTIQPSSTTTPTATAGVPAIAALLPSSIRSAGSVSVASESYPPASYLNAQNKFAGWEVAMGKALGKVLGISFNFHLVQFSALIPGLQAGRYELGMGDIAVTSAREKIVDFVSTDGSGNGFMEPKSSKLDITTLAGLCGHQVGVLVGSVEATSVTGEAATCTSAHLPPMSVHQFETQPQVNLALSSSRVQVEVASSGTLTYAIGQAPGAFKYTGNYGGVQPTGIAIAMNSNSGAMEKALQAAVDYIIKNRTYASIMKTYNNTVDEVSKAVINPLSQG